MDFKTIKAQWEKEAKEMTLANLPTFIKHLTKDYTHDYGTICHAMSIGAIATIWAMNKSNQGGITGFQAGAVMWEFIHSWNYSNNKAGLRLIDYDDLLFPQMEYKFENTITKNVWKSLQKEAAENLKDSEHAVPDVIKHWQSIIDGTIPFNFKIKEN